MGQLLLVHGSDDAVARRLYDRALAVFAALYSIVPDAESAAGGSFAAHFPRMLGRGGPGAVHPGTPWISTAGTPVLRGASAADVARAMLDGRGLEDATRALDGYFVAVAVGSAPGGTDAAAVLTDRVGGLHAYIVETAGCVVVCTSSIVLAALAGAELDPVAVRELLASHSVFEARSMFTGVSKLPPATCVSLSGGRETGRHRWWNLADAMWDRSVMRGNARLLGDAVVEAVSALLAGFERPLFDLTGGYDSRNLLAAALAGGHRVSTVVNGRDGDGDVVAAGRIAREFGLDHRHQQPGRELRLATWADLRAAALLGDGECNVVDYAPVVIGQSHTAAEFDVTVNGSFGEVCRGYWWDLLGVWPGRRRPIDASRFAMRRFATHAWADRMTADRYPDTAADHFTRVIERAVADTNGMPNTAGADAAYIVLRMQRWSGRIVSLTSRIRPCAAPFMFARPLEAALSAPPRRRLFGRMAPRVVTYLNPRLASLPLEKGYPALPITPLTLHRFGPLTAELFGKVKKRLLGVKPVLAPRERAPLWDIAEVQDLLDSRTMVTRHFYNGNSLREFLERARGEHDAGPVTVGRVLTVELAARVLAEARALALR